MGDVGYLRARLPAISLDSDLLPIGPEEFSDLMMDSALRFWAVGVLDWVRLANVRCVQRRLAMPFPDAGAVPRLSWPEEPWAAYYERFTSLSAPAIIRGWANEDAAILAARGRANGRELGIGSRPVHPLMEGLIQEAGADIKPAAKRDKNILQFYFRWLDEFLFSSSPDGDNWVYAYALKLLVLIRNGRRLENRVAA